MREGQERRRVLRIERERWTDTDWLRVRALADQGWDAIVATQDGTALYLYSAEQACRQREYERADERFKALKAETERLAQLLRGDVGGDDPGRGEDVQAARLQAPADPTPRSQSRGDAEGGGRAA